MLTFSKSARLLCVASSLLAVTLAEAEVKSQPTINQVDSTLIERILDNAKLPYKEIDQNVYSIKIGDYKATLSVKKGDIQILGFFTGKKITLNRINEWNRAMKFSRAYLDGDGDPTLSSELDFEGGVTSDTIGRFFGLFLASMTKFHEHLQ